MCPTLFFVQQGTSEGGCACCGRLSLSTRVGFDCGAPLVEATYYFRAAPRAFTWAEGFLSLSGLRKLIASLSTSRGSVWDWFTWSSEFWHQRLNFTEYLANAGIKIRPEIAPQNWQICGTKKNNFTRLAFCVWEQVQDLGGWHRWCLEDCCTIVPCYQGVEINAETQWTMTYMIYHHWFIES